MNNKQQPKETMTIKSILPKDELKKYNEFCYNSKNTIIPKDELKAYNKFCYNSKNNCLTLTPTSEPINIRGLTLYIYLFCISDNKRLSNLIIFILLY